MGTSLFLLNVPTTRASKATSTSSLKRPPAQQESHLDPDRHHLYRKIVGILIWAAQVRPDLQFTAKDHTRHLASPTEWEWQHLKHTLRYLKGTMHYNFRITSANSGILTTSSLVDTSSHEHILRQRLGHRHRLKEVYPWHSRLCTSSTSGIDSSTSGTTELRVQLLHQARKLVISDSLHINQLFQEHQHHLQCPTIDFGNLDTQCNFATSTATTSMPQALSTSRE